VLHRLSSPGASFFQNWRGLNQAAAQTLAQLLATRSPTLVGSHHAYFQRAVRSRKPVTFLHGPWGLEHRSACEAIQRSLFRRLRDELVVRVLHRVERRQLASSRRVLVASQYIAGRLREWHPSVAVPVEVVGGGADLKRFCPPADRSAVRDEFAILSDEFLMLSVRRLAPRMGLLGLVEAFARVTTRFPSARLWLAGRGPQQSELQMRIDEGGLNERVRLLGFVAEEKLPGLFGAADCVVMPSLDLEGFGLVTAEAVACGTPVLASRAGANAEVVGPLDERLLFDAGSVDSLAEKLDAVLSGRLALPERARCAAHAREHFRWDRPADAFERAHAEFATSGGGA
jgi:glycosyltransferase involved in cell wall biosynthesis